MIADDSGYPSAAFKRLARTRRSRSDWSEQHFEALLTGFGFTARTKGKHTFYTHSEFADVYVAVPRSRRLRCYVADQAIGAIDEVLARKGISHDG
jgi:hypothetical protein